MNPSLLDIVQEKKTLKHLDPLNIPSHIAIIMDGNRRWAEIQDKPPEVGHWMGAEIITDIVKAAADLGVKTLTLYAFSTENWLRSRQEVDALMQLFEVYLQNKREEMVKEGVCLHTIGDISRFPKSVLERLKETKNATANNTSIDLVLALNYGGRDDIRRAALKAYEDMGLGLLEKEELTESRFASYLDTARWGDPQLLIRTGGERRVSNFLLWQISYTEMMVIDDYWPDFSKNHLLEAIHEYQSRQKRIGR